MDYRVEKYFKPFKTYGEYGIFPILLSEHFGRVKGILYREGLVPLTLVRCYDIEYGEYFVPEVVSLKVAGLSKSFTLNKF